MIGPRCFVECSLEYLEVPATVQSIGESAFQGCLLLKTLTFERGSQLAEIGASAFAETAVEQFLAPENLRRLGDGAFAHCVGLQRV